METLCKDADILTFHVPLNLEGEDATWHMVNREFLASLSRKPCLSTVAAGKYLIRVLLWKPLKATS